MMTRFDALSCFNYEFYVIKENGARYNLSFRQAWFLRCSLYVGIVLCDLKDDCLRKLV